MKPRNINPYILQQKQHKLTKITLSYSQSARKIPPENEFPPLQQEWKQLQSTQRLEDLGYQKLEKKKTSQGVLGFSEAKREKSWG